MYLERYPERPVKSVNLFFVSQRLILYFCHRHQEKPAKQRVKAPDYKIEMG